MNFGFDYGGLLISSPLDFYGLPRALDGTLRDPDISIRLKIGALPRRRPVSHDWKGRFGLELERGDHAGDGWTIRYRDEIAVECDAGATMLDCTCRDAESSTLLAEMLARRILPRATNRRGRMPIHGASLANDQGAVLLFGGSGAGKSTLTAAAAATGWQILSDDMSILSGPDDPHAWQASPGVSLWGDSKDALGLPADECREIGGYDGKFWFAPPWRPLAAPVSLRALIFLSGHQDAGDDPAVALEPLTGAQAILLAVSQMVLFDPGDVAESGRTMDRFTRLVANVPRYRLSYRREYATLPDVLDVLAEIHADARRRDL